MSQPIFGAIDISTAATLRSGGWLMLGVHTPSQPLKNQEGETPNERIIALIRADVLRLPKSVLEVVGTRKPVVLSVLSEYIEVADAPAAKLLAQYLGSNSAASLRNELDSLEDRGISRLLESASIVTRSGNRAKAESVVQWIYPTEMDPPEIPQNLTGPIAKAVDFTTPLSFTSFTTRNLGTTVEVDPVASFDRSVIDLNIAPEIVSYFGDTMHGREESEAAMPLLATMRTSTAASIPNGDTILLSVHMPLDEKTQKPNPDKRIFLLVTASCLEVE
jgi:hypothetical protein